MPSMSTRASAVFRYTEESLETTGEWFSFWALTQKRKMKEDFQQEGANLALRFKLAAILHDATEVSESEYQILTNKKSALRLIKKTILFL